MDISINWLNNILNFHVPIKKTKQLDKLLTFYGFNPNYLTLNGFEVETIYNKEVNNTDIIVEIDTTPNRRDLYSVAGICNELTVLDLNQDNSHFTTTQNLTYAQRKISKAINVKTSSKSIFYVQAQNITVGESPQWLKNRLLTHNIEPSNIFTDLTYYLQLEWGQTIQFYDLNKIHNFNLKLEQKNQTGFLPINSSEKIVVSDCMTISNTNQILSLCGVELNADIQVNEKTTAVLIECANYSRKTIKQPKPNKITNPYLYF